ncbi:hypothetical protein IAT38_004343 [Cryptococcus sp. DSM 104549]
MAETSHPEAAASSKATRSSTQGWRSLSPTTSASLPPSPSTPCTPTPTSRPQRPGEVDALTSPSTLQTWSTLRDLSQTYADLIHKRNAHLRAKPKSSVLCTGHRPGPYAARKGGGHWWDDPSESSEPSESGHATCHPPLHNWQVQYLQTSSALVDICDAAQAINSRLPDGIRNPYELYWPLGDLEWLSTIKDKESPEWYTEAERPELRADWPTVKIRRLRRVKPEEDLRAMSVEAGLEMEGEGEALRTMSREEAIWAEMVERCTNVGSEVEEGSSQDDVRYHYFASDEDNSGERGGSVTSPLLGWEPTLASVSSMEDSFTSGAGFSSQYPSSDGQGSEQGARTGLGVFWRNVNRGDFASGSEESYEIYRDSDVEAFERGEGPRYVYL